MASPKVKEAQASGKFTILFDSGIRSGADIFRAIALGAQGVLRESQNLDKEYTGVCSPEFSQSAGPTHTRSPWLGR